MTARLTEDEIAALAELDGEGHTPPTVADPTRGAVTVDPSRPVDGRPRRELTLPVREIEGSRSAPRESDTVADVMESRRRKGMPARPDEMPTAADRMIGALANPTSEATSPESRRASSEVARTRRGLMGDIDETLGLSRRAGELPAQLRSVPIIGDSLGDWVESGTAGASGSAQGATIGFGDELAGAAGYIHGGGDPEAYTRERDRVRETARRDREASPNAFMAGEFAGALATAPLTPSISRSGLGLAERMGAGVLEGAGYGALAGAGYSDGSGEELLTDAVEGGLGGAVSGGVFSGVGEVGGAAVDAGRRFASGADRARVASVLSTGNNPLSVRAERDAAALPGGIPELARFIRREGIGTRAGTVGDSAARASEAADRTGARVGEFNRAIDEALPDGIPVDRFASTLEGVGDELRLDPYTSPAAPRMDESAGRWRTAAADGARTRALGSPRRAGPLPEGVDPEAITSPAAREAMGTLRSSVDFSDPIGSGADLDAYRALRREYDRVAEEVLPPEMAERFRPARDDHARASVLERYSRDAASRAARAPGPGMRGALAAVAASTMGAGPVGATMAAEGGGMIARRRPAMEATAAEAVQALLESRGARALGEYGPAMMRALERGGAAFAGRHAALMRSDPEYATAVESAMAVEEATTETPRTARELFEAGLETDEEPPRRTARELFEAGLE